MQMIRTSILVCIGELFFRANGLRAGLTMFQKIFTDFSLQTVYDRSIFTFGIDRYDCLIVLVALSIVFIISVLQEHHIQVRKQISKQNMVVRFAAYYALILLIVVFGAYGKGYIPVDPIYAGF